MIDSIASGSTGVILRAAGVKKDLRVSKTETYGSY